MVGRCLRISCEVVLIFGWIAIAVESMRRSLETQNQTPPGFCLPPEAKFSSRCLVCVTVCSRVGEIFSPARISFLTTRSKNGAVRGRWVVRRDVYQLRSRPRFTCGNASVTDACWENLLACLPWLRNTMSRPPQCGQRFANLKRRDGSGEPGRVRREPQRGRQMASLRLAAHCESRYCLECG